MILSFYEAGWHACDGVGDGYIKGRYHGVGVLYSIIFETILVQSRPSITLSKCLYVLSSHINLIVKSSNDSDYSSNPVNCLP